MSLGFAGFAFALFATGALALVHPPQLVVPAVTLLAGTLHPWLLYENRELLRWKIMRAVPVFTPGFLLSLCIGIAAGSLLLAVAAPWGGRLALGLVVLAFVAYSVRADLAGSRERAWRADGPATGRLVGLFAGLLQGWLGTGGPPIVAYLTNLGLDRGTFIVAFSATALLSDVFRSLAYAYSGYWTGGVLGLYLVSLPVAVGGFLVGMLLRRVLRAEVLFRRVILGLLGVNGAALVVRGLQGWVAQP